MYSSSHCPPCFFCQDVAPIWYKLSFESETVVKMWIVYKTVCAWNHLKHHHFTKLLEKLIVQYIKKNLFLAHHAMTQRKCK